MIADALGKAQAAYVALLNADTDLTTALGGAHVYDAVPHSRAFPYVVLGAASARDWSGNAAHGAELSITFDIYSRARGRSQANTLAGLLAAALTTTPSVPGHRVVLAEIQRVETGRLRDARTYRARISLRVLIERA